MKDESGSKQKMKKTLEEAGIATSICDTKEGMPKFGIPLYDDTFISGFTYAGIPLIGEFTDEENRSIVLDLSAFVLKISNQIIYHVLDCMQDTLEAEKNKVAFAFLQRASISHICNHKLSSEGITTERHGMQCYLVDEYKTIPLTRSVYEDLAMFYYLFDYSDNSCQREVIWNSWILRSKNNLFKDNLPEYEQRRKETQEEIDEIKKRLSNNVLVEKCLSNSQGHYKTCLRSHYVFTIIEKDDKCIAEKLTYEKAWEHLYGEESCLSLIYTFLSIHSHPTYIGLNQFINGQDSSTEFPLYASCHFLSYMCRLFMKQLHIDNSVITASLTEREQGIFSLLSNGFERKPKIR